MKIGTYLPQPPRRFFIVCTLPLVVDPLLQYLGTAPFGSWAFLWLTIWVYILVVPALFALVVAPVLLIFRRARLVAIRSLVGAPIVLAAVFAGTVLGDRVRMLAFYFLAERSSPLVEAIHAYEISRGTPPPDLAALVPDFLPIVPGTGMAAYPTYRYYVGERAANYYENPWVLSIFAPKGGVNFDEFHYFPLQNYPDHWVSTERIADWFYIHE